MIKLKNIAVLMAASLVCAAGLLSVSKANADMENTPLYVVELFTSQSCYSCPPADLFLTELAKNENVVALGCHVTYWNHLHWEDTLSTEDCTKRQREMASYVSRGRVFTPQMVVNGEVSLVGSRKKQAQKVLKNIAKETRPALVRIMKKSNQLHVQLPLLKTIADDQYKVIAFPYIAKTTQRIPSGENAGKTLSYSNAVSAVIDLESWDGMRREMTLSHDQFHGNDGVAVIAQDKTSGKILAAGDIKLR